MKSQRDTQTMHVRLSSDAEKDLDAIFSYIARENPAAAHRQIDRVLTTISMLETFPLLGKPGRVKDTRELVVARTRFFVVYTIPDAFHVDVERVLHAARDYPWR